MDLSRLEKKLGVGYSIDFYTQGPRTNLIDTYVSQIRANFSPVPFTVDTKIKLFDPIGYSNSRQDLINGLSKAMLLAGVEYLAKHKGNI